MLNGPLSILIFLPLLGAVFVMILPKSFKFYSPWVFLFCISLMWYTFLEVYKSFDHGEKSYQLVQHLNWIKLTLGNTAVLSIDYIVGIDGISYVMLLLTLIVFTVGGIASFKVKKRERTYFSLLLIMLSAVIGCFVSVDFFLFFIFFEFMLLPMYFLIGIWGGPNRSYAAMKFIIYTLVGSVLILVAMIAFSVSYTDDFFSNEFKKLVYTFDFRVLSDLTNIKNSGGLLSIKNPVFLLGFPARDLMFFFLLIGFGIKLPFVPFHTWLPDAHVEASTPVSVILAGILLKIGGYGFIRILYGLMPDKCDQYAVFIGLLGMIAILYAGFVALAQKDLKKLIAYSSVSHMGFVLLGIAAGNVEGLSGAVYQMFSHGLISSTLFILVGVLYDRTSNREIKNYKGLIQKMPYFSVFAGFGFFAAMGLPGFSGFIGEFFTLFSAFKSDLLPKYISILSVIGLLIAAIYFLWTFQKMFFGVFHSPENFEHKLVDLKFEEILCLSFLLILTIIYGVFPDFIFSYLDAPINNLLKL